MVDIIEVDEAINEHIDIVKLYVKTCEIENLCEFTLDNFSSIPWEQLKHKGVYQIDVRNDEKHNNLAKWLIDFRSRWETIDYKDIKSSRIYKGCTKHYTEHKEWIPLNIGISRAINKRIGEHLVIPLNSGAYALTIQARTNLKNYTFRIKKLVIDVNNYETIRAKIEREIRTKINPIIGKQKIL